MCAHNYYVPSLYSPLQQCCESGVTNYASSVTARMSGVTNYASGVTARTSGVTDDASGVTDQVAMSAEIN